jgi:hypothetical protein
MARKKTARQAAFSGSLYEFYLTNPQLVQRVTV